MSWTSTDNQDLYAGKLFDALPGQKVTVSAWIKDADPAGKARMCLTFYKADQKTVISSQYSGSYSADGPAWAQYSYAYAAPAETAYVRGFVRFYDDKGWAGTATSWVDDWALAIQ